MCMYNGFFFWMRHLLALPLLLWCPVMKLLQSPRSGSVASISKTLTWRLNIHLQSSVWPHSATSWKRGAGKKPPRVCPSTDGCQKGFCNLLCSSRVKKTNQKTKHRSVCTDGNYVVSAYCNLRLLLCPQMVLFTLGHVINCLGRAVSVWNYSLYF